MSEQRIDDIEIKLMRQEDLIETLNRTVYEQGRKIDLLEAMIGTLARRIPEAPADDPGRDIVHEIPPHY